MQKLICSLLMAILLSFSLVTAAKTDTAISNSSSQSPENGSKINQKEKDLLDRKIYEKRKIKEEFREKYNALTEAQKKAIADIEKKMVELKKQKIDLYEKYGLIDKSNADMMRERFSNLA